MALPVGLERRDDQKSNESRVEVKHDVPLPFRRVLEAGDLVPVRPADFCHQRRNGAADSLTKGVSGR
jgi:hypothetical protein